MSTVTLKDLEESAIEQLSVKPEYPVVTLDNKQVVQLIEFTLPEYQGIVKPVEEVSDDGVKKMISVQHNIKYNERMGVPWGMASDITLDESQLILYTGRLWSDLSRQIDKYVRNHPVMLAEEPPEKGVVVINHCKAHYDGTGFFAELNVILSFTVYFQP